MDDFTYTAIDRWSYLVHLERDMLNLGHTPVHSARQSSLRSLWHQWQATFSTVESLEAFATDMACAIPKARGLLAAVDAAKVMHQLAHVNDLVQALLADPAVAALRTPTARQGRLAASPQSGEADRGTSRLTAAQYLYPLARDMVVENRRHGLTYVFRQLLGRTSVWESTPRHARDITEVARGVQAGFLYHCPRWAVQLSDETGPRAAYLTGLDAQGAPLSELRARKFEAATTIITGPTAPDPDSLPEAVPWRPTQRAA